jgi:NADPH:quinone reductase-like Zn-dependent oxidoreductase
MCAAGLTNACANVPFASAFGRGSFGGQSFGGTLADLVRGPFADHMLLPLPHGLTPEVAAGVPDNVSDGYRCIAPPLTALPQPEVLVIGGLAQSVGLYAVTLVQSRSAQTKSSTPTATLPESTCGLARGGRR